VNIFEELIEIQQDSGFYK